MTRATIHRIDPSDEAGVAEYVRIRNAVTPDNTGLGRSRSRWESATYPGEVSQFLADDRGGDRGRRPPRRAASGCTSAGFRAVLARDLGDARGSRARHGSALYSAT